MCNFAKGVAALEQQFLRGRPVRAEVWRTFGMFGANVYKQWWLNVNHQSLRMGNELLGSKSHDVKSMIVYSSNLGME